MEGVAPESAIEVFAPTQFSVTELMAPLTTSEYVWKSVVSDLAHTDTVHVPLSTSKASTITLSFTFASSGSPDSHIVYLVPLGEKTARSRSWTSCLAEKEVAAGSIQESVTRKSKPAVPFTSKRYSCNVSSGMEVLAASATKRTKLPSPSSGIP